MNANDSVKSCPVCSGNQMRKYLVANDPDGLFSYPFTLLKCKNCGLVFLKNIINPGVLYTKDYYRNPKLGIQFFFDFALCWFMAKRVAVIKRYKSGLGRILDIGCGDGAFLTKMKGSGWYALAVDSSPAAHEYLLGKGIVLISEDFLNAKIEENSLDAVTFWYSFEHLLNPVAHLKEAYRVLKEDGILAIAVQNIDSLQATISGRRWFHLDLPRHVLHFSPRTLASTLRSNGFKVLKAEHRSVQMNVFGWYQSLLNLLGFPQNIVYKLTKREAMPWGKILPLLLIALTISPFLFFLSVALSRLEELFHKGGAVTIIAKKYV